KVLRKISDKTITILQIITLNCNQISPEFIVPNDFFRDNYLVHNVFRQDRTMHNNSLQHGGTENQWYHFRLMLYLIEMILYCSHNYKLFTREFSFIFACLPIGKLAFTFLSHAIYSTSSIRF
ncbi:MAG: hypothetical protein LBC74_05880, partial [Planctomycetaceae bacterium]|nr:hypothetical protein [Planctomycetaceae bacterium]